MEATNLLITDQSLLNEFCKAISSAKYIAIDTEFVRQDCYYPKLCLIQIAYKDKIAVIDALEDLDFKPLIKILEDKSILKLLHSATQDFEALFAKLKTLPINFIDTQIAAAFLGFGDSIGYDKLVKHYLNIALNKSLQYSSWDRRPLKQTLIDYALQDVEFLYKIYKIMRTELKSVKFYEMAKAESKRIYKQMDIVQIVQNIFLKLSDNFDDITDYKMLAAILWLREEIALGTNTRRNLVISDDAICYIVRKRFINSDNAAVLCIKNVDALLNIETDPEIVKFVDSTYSWRHNTQHDFDSIQQQLITLRNKISEETKIAATLIATASDIRHFILSKFKGSRIIKSWRKVIFADRAFKVLGLG